jgi:KEOPS complex subunit Pcc1
MTARASAKIILNFKSEKKSAAILDALKPEANAPVTRRTIVNLEKQDAFLVLYVDAKDTVALRATINAYLRWINSTLGVMDLMDNI